MSNTFNFDEIREAALAAKADMIMKGKKPCGIRTRPRSEKDLEALRLRALAIMEKYPPRLENGVVILPYFNLTEESDTRP